MKIAIFTDTYYPQINGVTVTLENFSKEMRKRGHTVYIYAPKMRGENHDDKYVIRIPSFMIVRAESDIRMPIFLPDSALLKMFRLDFDLIHAYGNGPFSLLGLQVAKLKGKPFVMGFDTLYTEYTHYFLNGKILKPKMVAQGLKIFAGFCDGVATPSIKMKSELKSFGVKKEIKVIPNFVDPAKFSSVEKGFLHTQIGIPVGDPIVLSVGRLGKEKNFSFLIKVFRKVNEKAPNAHLVIVGQGLEKKNLEKQIAKLNLQSNIHLTGMIEPSDMPRVFADSTIFVFASVTETQGLVVLEAAASGLPLVVVEDEAFENMVQNGENGFTLPPNIGLFSSKILQLLKDSELRGKMSERSRQIVKENFDKDKIVDDLLLFYEHTIQNYKPKAKALRQVISKILLAV